MRTALKDVCIVLTGLIALARFVITPRFNLPTKTGSYEAFAHIFIGVLLGVWLASKSLKSSLFKYGVKYVVSDEATDARWAMWCFWGVSILELVMFLIQKAMQ